MILIRSVPIYWGVERDAVDRSLITRSTMEEALPPYRYSTFAFRIRVSHRHWLHLGLCRFKDTVTPWGLEVDPNQIGAWGRKSDGPEEAEDEGFPSPEQVRSLREGRPDRLDRGDDDEERGDVPGAESLGTGPGVGAVSA